VSGSIHDLLALSELQLPDLEARLHSPETHRDVRYGQMTGLTMLNAPDAVFYFSDAGLAVARLVDPDPDEADELLARGGERLRSSAGKRATVHVQADRGLAVTEEDGEVRYVEVFPPTTFDDYRERIYKPPLKFVE
jgi:hypothetical protein